MKWIAVNRKKESKNQPRSIMVLARGCSEFGMASESMNETKRRSMLLLCFRVYYYWMEGNHFHRNRTIITGVVCVVAYPTAAQIRSTTRLIANYVLATTRVERATIKALFIFQVFK